MDEVVRTVHETKVDRRDFAALEKSIEKGRAESIYNDMQALLDQTVAHI